MKPMPGDRVLVKHKHAYGEGAGTWGTVHSRQGKRHFLVVYDGAKKRRCEHDADAVQVTRAPLIRGTETKENGR